MGYSSYSKDKQREYNISYHIKNKVKINLNKNLTRRANQALKTHEMFGKLKLIKLPNNTIATLHERFRVDESSKSGLRWSESSANRPYLRGKEAGCLHTKTGYYQVSIYVGLVKYNLSVARIVWMMVNNRDIELGMQVDHINKKRDDNRISNLKVGSASCNNINRRHHCYNSNLYKNVFPSGRRFHAYFKYLGIVYRTKSDKSEDRACVLGWELLTSGEVPLDYIKSQIDEWKDGTYLQTALAECAKHGIAVTPPKFKTLYEYIASVEGSC